MEHKTVLDELQAQLGAANEELPRKVAELEEAVRLLRRLSILPAALLFIFN